MTKDELRKEATTTVEWECTPMIDRPTFVNGYIVGAEPRENEITELKERLEIEQNARGDWFGKAVTKDRRLAEAKELIELLLSDNRIMKAQFESEEQANTWFEHIHQAEQFLKENV